MRSNRKLQTVAVLGVVAAIGLAACEDLITESPPHILTTDALFSSPAGFDAGVSALYGTARLWTVGVGQNAERWRQNNHRMYAWTLGTDIAYAPFGTCVGTPLTNWSNPTAPVGGGRFTSLEACYHHIWGWLYELVNAANTIEGRIDDVVWPNQAAKDLILAEARFFRAWAYRKLTYMWGPVPLSLEESRSVKEDWVRAPVAEVLAQIEQDLVFAAQHFPPVTRTASRISSATALHYLAENYLRMGRYADAQQAAEQVINSGNYSLVTSRYGVEASAPGTPFTDIFIDGNVLRSQGNTEALWVFEFDQSATGGDQNSLRRAYATRYYEIPGIPITYENGGRGQQRGAPTKFAFELYHDEPQDDRYSRYAVRNWYIYSEPSFLPIAPPGTQLGDTLWLPFTNDNYGDPTIWTTRKYESGTDRVLVSLDESFNDILYLRLAETYFLAAEAAFRQGRLAEAAEHLNVVRRRANVSDISAADVTIDFILDERSRELLLEEERRYHLLRTGRWYERTRAHNPSGVNIEPKDTLFPIPQLVIDTNRGAAMEQNPGW